MKAQRSKIFQIIHEYCEESLAYDPISATIAGRKEFDSDWNDYTYHPVDPFLKVVKTTHAKLTKQKSVDAHDERARKVILGDLERYIDQDPKDLVFYYTYWGASFNPLDDVAAVFDFMDRKTPEDVSNIIKRLEKIPNLCVEWISSLKDVAELGEVNAKCRVEWTIDNIRNHSQNTFSRLLKELDPLKENKKLARAIKDAELAFEVTAAWLNDVYMKLAKDDWRLGERRYVKSVEEFTGGMKIDPREVYEYGLAEIERINKEMKVVAKQIAPRARSAKDVVAHLNINPRYIIKDKDKMQAFLSALTHIAITQLNNKYFVISPRIKRCDTKLDEDTIDESPYYFGPSLDLKRPGFAVFPTLKKEKFTTWDNISTWYHETVPGHHMQIATATAQGDKLSDYQRGEGWNSGYGEGWALYSETLMDELGYFNDPGDRMGYLMNQAMRAARLVVDIGLHLGYKDPKGNVWTFRSAKKFMVERALLSESYAENEIKRYISWGGQAVSYKLGERVWFEAREDAKARLGDKFDIKKFHMYALKLGPMGLDMLREELAGWNGR